MGFCSVGVRILLLFIWIFSVPHKIPEIFIDMCVPGTSRVSSVVRASASQSGGQGSNRSHETGVQISVGSYQRL